jgi:hypothetical protein
MSHWSLYDRAAALIPFSLRERSGTVAVYYALNDDPIHAGFDFLAGLNFTVDQCRGNPVIHARVERYAGSGYRTLCGWIQVVTAVYRDSHDREEARTTTRVSVDDVPALAGSDVPYVSFGNLPQLFDAPCHNLGESAELRWMADTFLTTLPLRSRDEEIEWLLGFRWGYLEDDRPDQKPILLPLEVTDARAWNGHLPLLAREYGGWRFKGA